MLASKPYPTTFGVPSMQSTAATYSSSSPKKVAMASNPREGVFTSPTESEFSDLHDGPDSVRYVQFPHEGGILLEADN